MATLAARARRWLFVGALLSAVTSPGSDSAAEDPATSAERGDAWPVETRPNQEKLRPRPEAAIPPTPPSWLEAPYATGDWGGTRSWLADHGVVPTLTYAADVQANVSGGKRQAGRYFHQIGFDLLLDLEKLAGLPGMRVHLSVAQQSGRSLTADAVGSVFTVADVCCGTGVQVADVALEQSLFSDRLELEAGRIAPGDDFLSSPLDWTFLSSAIDANPAGVTFQVPFSAYPNTTWGAHLKARPTPGIELQLGVYDGEASFIGDGDHGLDWGFHGGAGLLMLAEGAWRWNAGSTAHGLPGTVSLGGFYHSGPFAVLDEPGKSERGNGGMYLYLDQKVWSPGGPRSARGPTPFVWLTYAPDESLSQMPFFASAGVVWRGVFASRKDDELALGGEYGWFSPKQRRQQERERAAGQDVVVQSFEGVIELGYAAQLTPWLVLEPDVQYVIRPGAGGALRNALVLGTQIVIAF